MIKKVKHVASCSGCGSYVDYDTNSYYSSDNTYKGECDSCGMTNRASCKEVDDFIGMRGEYAEGTELYKIGEEL